MKYIIIFLIMFSITTSSFSLEKVTHNFFMTNTSDSALDSDVEFYIQTADGKKYGYDFDNKKEFENNGSACYYTNEGIDAIETDEGDEVLVGKEVKGVQACKFPDDNFTIFIKSSSSENFQLTINSSHDEKEKDGTLNIAVPTLKDIANQYKIKLSPDDFNKITLTKTVNETTIEQDINACTDGKFFVHVCPKPTKKFTYPDECVIGSEPDPGKTKAPLKKSGNADRCTMKNVCYAQAMKDISSEIKDAYDISRKKLSVQKLIKILKFALESKELKAPCDQLLKNDLETLLDLYK